MNKSDRAPLLLPAYPHRYVNMHEALRYITRASHVRSMEEPALVHCETLEDFSGD